MLGYVFTGGDGPHACTASRWSTEGKPSDETGRLRPRLRRSSPSRLRAAVPSARPPCARPPPSRSPRRSSSSSRCSPPTARPRCASWPPASWPPAAAPRPAPSCASGSTTTTRGPRRRPRGLRDAGKETPLAAPRAALDSRFADIRIAAPAPAGEARAGLRRWCPASSPASSRTPMPTWALAALDALAAGVPQGQHRAAEDGLRARPRAPQGGGAHPRRRRGLAGPAAAAAAGGPRAG